MIESQVIMAANKMYDFYFIGHQGMEIKKLSVFYLTEVQLQVFAIHLG